MPSVVFDHVAVALPRLTDALPFVVGELGGRYCGGGDALTFLWRQYRFAGGGILELLEASGEPGGFVHRFVDLHGGGVHHVTFKVDDLAAICRRAESLGFSVVGYDDSDPEWMEAFLHPRSAMGVVVQLAAVGGDGEIEGAAPQPPPDDDPVPGPPIVSLVGLRMAVSDLDRARRLWSELLGGELESSPRRPVVRWPTSPLRITLDPAAGGEGPAAIEVECLRPVLLPRGRHPVLHTTFEPIDPTPTAEDSEPEATDLEDDDREVYLLEEPDP